MLWSRPPAHSADVGSTNADDRSPPAFECRLIIAVYGRAGLKKTEGAVKTTLQLLLILLLFYRYNSAILFTILSSSAVEVLIHKS